MPEALSEKSMQVLMELDAARISGDPYLPLRNIGSRSIHKLAMLGLICDEPGLGYRITEAGTHRLIEGGKAHAAKPLDIKPFSPPPGSADYKRQSPLHAKRGGAGGGEVRHLPLQGRARPGRRTHPRSRRTTASSGELRRCAVGGAA